MANAPVLEIMGEPNSYDGPGQIEYSGFGNVRQALGAPTSLTVNSKHPQGATLLSSERRRGNRLSPDYDPMFVAAEWLHAVARGERDWKERPIRWRHYIKQQKEFREKLALNQQQEH